MTTWQEYLNARGKLQEKPAVKLVGDYDGPDPKSPDQSVSKGKGWDAKAQKGDKPSPYRAPGTSKKQSTEKGFGDLGPKNLKYEPDTDTSNGRKKMSSMPKENFVNQTKDMKITEFVNHMLKECGHIHEENLPTVTGRIGEFHPYPIEAIKYVAALSKNNKRMLENLLHELKKEGMLKPMLESLLINAEDYASLGELFNDPKRCRSLSRALEAVAQPIVVSNGKEDEEDEDEENDELSLGDDEEDGESGEEDKADDPEGEDGDDLKLGDDEEDDDHPLFGNRDKEMMKKMMKFMSKR